MGQRTYLPALGRFLQTDPVEGGSANDYDYANADAVNQFDLAGTCAFDKDVLGKVLISGPYTYYEKCRKGHRTGYRRVRTGYPENAKHHTFWRVVGHIAGEALERPTTV